MIGDSLLVSPVTEPGANSVTTYLPGLDPWYDIQTFQTHYPSSDAAGTVLSAPLDTIPVLLRGGKIIPRKMRLRRSSKLMFHDPYTLIVALDRNNFSEGYLYVDDETTLDHEERPLESCAYRVFRFESNILSNKAVFESSYKPANKVERIVILGVSKAPSSISITVDGAARVLESFFDTTTKSLTIKKPHVAAVQDWSIELR